MDLTLTAVNEDRPGPKWLTGFQDFWPRYRAWCLKEGEAARADLDSCRRALHEHMPELVPVHDILCALVGDDPIAQACLSGWNPPRVISGCSFAGLARSHPVLIRNYDFKVFEEGRLTVTLRPTPPSVD